jgi:hypothetical protein
MENPSEIIALLQEQNRTLHQLLEFHQHKERAALRDKILGIILHAIPYIALIILGYFLFTTIKEYLDALNNNINALRDGFVSIQTSIGRFIPDFSGITESLSKTWQDTKNIFQ